MRFKEDAYMDALDAELDEIIAASKAAKTPSQAIAAQAATATDIVGNPSIQWVDSRGAYSKYGAYLKYMQTAHKATLVDAAKGTGLALGTMMRAAMDMVAAGYMEVLFGSGKNRLISITDKGLGVTLPEGRDPKGRVTSKSLQSSLVGCNTPKWVTSKDGLFVEFVNRINAFCDKHPDCFNSGASMKYVSSEISNGNHWCKVYAKSGAKPFTKYMYLFCYNPNTHVMQGIQYRGWATSGTDHTDKIILTWESPTNHILDALKKGVAEEEKAAKYEKNVYKYDFYAKHPGDVSKEEVIKQVEATKGKRYKYYARHGLGYRGAREHEVSYDAFRNDCRDAYAEITVDHNTKECHVNTYSENDMY